MYDLNSELMISLRSGIDTSSDCAWRQGEGFSYLGGTECGLTNS